MSNLSEVKKFRLLFSISVWRRRSSVGRGAG